MRIRLFILLSMLFPIILLSGLEVYLGKYDQHSRYLSQLKDTLFKYSENEGVNSNGLASVVEDIEKGNFLDAGACLRAGRAGGSICTPSIASRTFKNITNIDILKGGYKESVDEYIKDYRENKIINRYGFDNKFTFGFDFNFISDSDIDSWAKFNQKITGERYSYYTRNQKGSFLNKEVYVNGGSVFQPIITYSNVKTNDEGRFRILVLSDSFGAGAGLMSIDETWAKELERQLNLIEDKYEIVTLTNGGAGYKDYLRWVEEGYVEEIDPDLVLVSYFRNDFNLLHDFDKNFFHNSEGMKFSGLEKELVFYLQCFEKDDDLFVNSLKKINKFFPNIYRFYKFSRCGDELSLYESEDIIDKLGVVSSYKRIDNLINVPTYLYQIESKLNLFEGDIKRDILMDIQKNGLTIINEDEGSIKNKGCGEFFDLGYINCEPYKANKFDNHFNMYYNKLHINGMINNIKKIIDYNFINRDSGKPSKEIPNKSESIIVDYLPNTLFVSNTSRNSSLVGFLDGNSYGYGRSSINFCVPFDRKGVVINFNSYLTEGKEIKISSEYQGSGLGLVSRGYDKDGRVVFGEAVELKVGETVTFLGSELVRGLVVLGNNRDCSSNDIDISEEFLIKVSVV